MTPVWDVSGDGREPDFNERLEDGFDLIDLAGDDIGDDEEGGVIFTPELRRYLVEKDV